LKRAIGKHITHIEELPPMDEEGQLVLIPEEILEVRERKEKEASENIWFSGRTYLWKMLRGKESS
jgi:hypothetical protein